MISSNSPFLARQSVTRQPIPSVLPNYTSGVSADRNSIRNSVNGDNRGVGLGFNSEGQIALQFYKDYMPPGKSGYVCRFTPVWDFGVSTPIAYSYENMRVYDDVEDLTWFYCINPPPFDCVNTNIKTFNGLEPIPLGLTQFMPFPTSAGCVIFIIKDALFTSASTYGFL